MTDYPEQRNDATPPRVQVAEGEYWRRQGYELVMRAGTPKQRMGARSRLDEVLTIRRLTEKWMAEQRAVAA